MSSSHHPSDTNANIENDPKSQHRLLSILPTLPSSVSTNKAFLVPPQQAHQQVTNDVENVNSNAQTPDAPKRRRHADIPHKVTYLYAITRSIEQLELIAQDPFTLGPLNNVCQHCDALFFEKEPKNRQSIRLQCCKNGAIHLPQLGTCPAALRKLYTDNGTLATEFRTKVRTLNSLFALASFKTSHPEASRVRGQGHWCFTVCGQTYHFLHGIPIHRQQLENPRLSTYYFLNIDQALRKRNEFLKGEVSEQLVELIETTLRCNHVYIQAYITMHNVINHHQGQHDVVTTRAITSAATSSVVDVRPTSSSTITRKKSSRLASQQRGQHTQHQYEGTKKKELPQQTSQQKVTRNDRITNTVINNRLKETTASPSSSILPIPSNANLTKRVISLLPNHANIENITIGFTKEPIMRHQLKAHNLPDHGSDIAAVFFGGKPPFNVNLTVYPESPSDPNPRFRHQELNILSPFADCFVYPLLFPYGDIGYSIDYKHRNNRNKTVTFNEYYRYQLQIRNRFSAIHHGGKLFQQFIVDAWLKSESNRLWFLKRNQEKFRVVHERNLLQMSAQHAQRDSFGQNVRQPQVPEQFGKRYILPSSFPGGPRNKYKLYLDSMATISRHGKPDLFITFTCNPNWKDISDNLKNYQKWEHRSDLVCRVFYNYLLNFLNDIIEKQFYGVVHNYFYVIEFQKRGLPHAHILITFRDENKLLTSAQVDQIIHAYIPDKETQPNLYKLVARHQVHKPCGPLNPNAPCMDDSKKMCQNHFPKKYNPHTQLHLGENKGPLYKRPDDGRTIFITDRPYGGGINVTNTSVIPYNPFALEKYQCHINFEAVGSIATIKYLHKYFNKGRNFENVSPSATNNAPISPSTTTKINRNKNGRKNEINSRNVTDEIQNYIKSRYVSNMEAMWRLLEYPLHNRSHSVMTLPVHLPNERTIVIQEDDDIEVIDERLDRYTKLEAWFRLNQIDAEARHLRYVDIPEHYIWENSTSTWRKRKQISKQIGCLIEITAAENVEKHYFSILLKYVRGATSYESLRTLANGTVCETFQHACLQQNLIRHNDEFDKALAEASLRCLPAMLRKFFARICCIAIDDNIAEIPYLWNKYQNALIPDLLNRGIDRQQAVDIVINFIGKIIGHDKSDIDIAKLGIVNSEPQRQRIRQNNVCNVTSRNINDASDLVAVVGRNNAITVHTDDVNENNIEGDNNRNDVSITTTSLIDNSLRRDDDRDVFNVDSDNVVNENKEQCMNNVHNGINIDDLIKDTRNESFTNYNINTLNKEQKQVYYEIIKTCATHDRFLIDMLDYEELLHPDDFQSLIDSVINIEQTERSERVTSSVDSNTKLSLKEIHDIDKEVNEKFFNHNNPNGYIFYLDGPGGTGKTYLYNTIIKNMLTRYRRSPIAVAWTGIAANLLIKGQTAHRAFKLPLIITNTTIPGWPLEHPRSTYIKNSALVIWDEASMTNKNAIAAIDRYLRDLTKLDVPMGGKIFLFGGDFRQILPVVVDGHANTVSSNCLQAWLYWSKIKKIVLSQNMRAQSQRIVHDFGKLKFSDWLLKLGDGRIPNFKLDSVPDAPCDLIEVPRLFRAASIDELLEFVYQNNFLDRANGLRAILCPTNNNVREINERILDSMSTNNPIRTYFSIDEYEYEEDELQVPQGLLHSIDVSSVPLHELKLKLGCIVILLKNLDIEAGQCNGSRYIINHLGEHFIELEALQGQQIGQRFYVPKMTIRAKSPILPKDFKRTQFPVKLAYAMTINKSQGQTLERVGVYLEEPCFTHGQLYVSFSRVTNHENIKIFIKNRNDQGTYNFRNSKIFTRNVVLKSVLLDSSAKSFVEDLRQLQQVRDEQDEGGESNLDKNNCNVVVNDPVSQRRRKRQLSNDESKSTDHQVLFKKPLPPPPKKIKTHPPTMEGLKDLLPKLSESFKPTETVKIPERSIVQIAEEISFNFAKSHISDENTANEPK